MKLEDIIKLPELSGFKLISGGGGLTKDVDSTEIIDFEFFPGIEFSREELFYGHSLGISSLMFAKDDPDLLLDSIIRLDEMGVACLGYKPIFYKELPEEVIRYSEEHAFPIFEITDDAFFEDIVLAIKKEAGRDMTQTEIEESIVKLLDNDLSENEIKRLANRIAPNLKEYIKVMCFTLEDWETIDREIFVKYIRRLSLNDRLNDRAAIVRFGRGGFIFLSREGERESDMKALLKDVIIASGLPEDKAVWGASSVLRRSSGFDQAIREAFWAQRVAAIEGEPSKEYRDLGIYRFLAPEMGSPTLVRNCEEFLRPLMGETEDQKTLLDTAAEYVSCGYDLNLAAEKLYCHKNTVRYRIRRIHEMTAQGLPEEDFRESLTLAVRVLILVGKIDMQ
ncbi:MAG: PucR family transcriptional regulator [Firmicutes bacterium]|nr:PucR family transcriptional regulator [Bacillota bacterium]